MDIQAIIDQVLETVGNAPDKAAELLQDPQAAIEEITGQDLGNLDLGGIDLSALGGLGGIGEALSDSPLGGIGNMLGGLFGRK